MKTLREYVDQLDEISRRDFLKGTGAAVAAAALGTPKDAEAFNMTGRGWKIDPNVAYMAGYIGNNAQFANEDDRTACEIYVDGVKWSATPALSKAYWNGKDDAGDTVGEMWRKSSGTIEQKKAAHAKHFASACKKLVNYVNQKHELEIRESPLEETAAESDVDRVIQLSREMR